MAFALGEPTDQRQHDVVGQQQRLDAAAQTAQAECHDRLAQLGRSADVAEPPSNVTLTSSLSLLIPEKISYQFKTFQIKLAATWRPII